MGDISRTVDGDMRWDGEADVVVVGASVAGFSTAVNAAELGASTILLEAAEQLGGTGRKAAAWAWIPNNHLVQEKGIPDSREDAMAYLARFARPALYRPGHPTLGLPAWERDRQGALRSRRHPTAAGRRAGRRGRVHPAHGDRRP